MDPQTFMEVATVVKKLKLYPYFDIAHYTLMCMISRDDHPVQQGSGKKIWVFDLIYNSFPQAPVTNSLSLSISHSHSLSQTQVSDLYAVLYLQAMLDLVESRSM